MYLYVQGVVILMEKPVFSYGKDPVSGRMASKTSGPDAGADPDLNCAPVAAAPAAVCREDFSISWGVVVNPGWYGVVPSAHGETVQQEYQRTDIL